MYNRTALAGVVMLEALWESRKKDMIDLILPLINYEVAKKTPLGSFVDTNYVMKMIRTNYGFVDIPESIIIKSIMRDKSHYRRENRSYKLIYRLDEQVEIIEKRKSDCQNKIDEIGNLLRDYLEVHCKKTRITDVNQVISLFTKYLSKYIIGVAFENHEEDDICPNKEEVNYYISRYILEAKESKGKEYDDILQIVKGFFLRTVLYMQGENTKLQKSKCKALNIYYDTPCLLQLLGYQSRQEQETAIELHNILKDTGAKFYCFPQTEEEVIGILTAYEHSLSDNRNSLRTLEGLDEKNYTPDGVKRLKMTFLNRLKVSFGVELCDNPGYAVNSDNYVDVKKVDISEVELIEYVKENTAHYKEESLMADIKSGLSIHRLRRGHYSKEIEKCRALFLTNNVDFTRAFNSYYSINVAKDIVMPIITTFDLSSIMWVKCGRFDSNIPERQLLTNAYMATQLPPEIMEKCQSILNQLEEEGIIPEDEAIALRADKVLQKEFWHNDFCDKEKIDDQYVLKMKNAYQKRLLNDKDKEYKKKSAEKKKQQKAEMVRKAANYAKNKKAKMIKILKISIAVIEVIVFVLVSMGACQSLNGVCRNITIVAFLLFTIWSTATTIIEKNLLISKFVLKTANAYETRVLEAKKREYLEVYEIEEEENEPIFSFK